MIFKKAIIPMFAAAAFMVTSIGAGAQTMPAATPPGSGMGSATSMPAGSMGGSMKSDSMKGSMGGTPDHGMPNGLMGGDGKDYTGAPDLQGAISLVTAGGAPGHFSLVAALTSLVGAATTEAEEAGDEVMPDSAVPTPSEKPVSKRRTPPAWPPTPSEKPTCLHCPRIESRDNAMSDLRETIREVCFDHSCSSHTADTVLDVITVHMAVTEEDATAALKDFYGEHYAVASIKFHPFKRRDMKAALEAFVAHKLKAETI